MTEVERLQKRWRGTVRLLLIVAATGLAIDAYDIWDSLRQFGSADWKLWLAPFAIVAGGGLLYGFMWVVMRIVFAWVEHKEKA